MTGKSVIPGLSEELSGRGGCTKEGSLNQCGWKMVRESLPRRGNVCLGGVPSKQSLEGEILYK